MKVGNIFIILALTCVWILLREDFTSTTILSGLFFAVVTHVFCRFALPPGKMNDAKFTRLVTYPLYIIGQVYVAGFYVVKMIFSGAEVEIVQMRTAIKSESLKAILVDSITLIPGSIFISLDDDGFKVLCIEVKGKKLSQEEWEESIKGSLERRLAKAQK